jgi:hypothetical protein
MNIADREGARTQSQAECCDWLASRQWFWKSFCSTYGVCRSDAHFCFGAKADPRPSRP